MASADSLPEHLNLSDIELIKTKYGLDEKATDAVKYLIANVPLANISQVFSSDYFIRKLIPVIECGSDMAKLRALDMLGRYLGLYDQKRKGSGKRVVIQ